MSKHTVKRDHEDGAPITPVFWCGRHPTAFEWYFQDTHHLALSIGGSQQPCKLCIKAIIKELNRELIGDI